MDASLRVYQPHDVDEVLALSLRAWAPVFASMEEVLGAELSVRLHGEDWRDFQERSVRRTLDDTSIRAWVAEGDRRVVGFVAATILDAARQLGEVVMLAVDPARQGRGVGTALTELATAWLRESGMRVAVIDSGGDAGHAPARRTYEKAGYTFMPMARYFRAL